MRYFHTDKDTQPKFGKPLAQRFPNVDENLPGRSAGGYYGLLHADAASDRDHVGRFKGSYRGCGGEE